MTNRFPVPIFLAFFLVPTLFADSWPTWRGDFKGSGKTKETDLPTKWDKDSANVKWRAPLPDRGNSTPIIVGEKIFLTQAVETEMWRGLMCLNRKDGEVMWKKGVTYAKAERSHRTNPYCSASPSTDGEIVVAAYGSAGVAAYDFDGKELWHRELGPADHTWGNATSPVIVGDVVVHYHGPGKGSFLIGLNRKTGETVWKWDEPDWKPGKRTDGFRGRDDEGVIGSFSTPILIEAEGRKELVMSFPMEMKAFDPATGDVLWTCGGLSPLVYTSPMAEDGLVVAMGGYQGDSIAVKAGGKGDVTESHRVWRLERHNGGIGTGVVKDGHYFYSNSGGVVFCLDMKTGETIWEERLPGPGKSWGSFVLAGDLIYSLSQPGETAVFKASTEGLDVIAQNPLGETTNSSPAVSDGEIFLRTHEALWCIGK